MPALTAEELESFRLYVSYGRQLTFTISAEASELVESHFLALRQHHQQHVNETTLHHLLNGARLYAASMLQTELSAPPSNAHNGNSVAADTAQQIYQWNSWLAIMASVRHRMELFSKKKPASSALSPQQLQQQQHSVNAVSLSTHSSNSHASPSA